MINRSVARAGETLTRHAIKAIALAVANRGCLVQNWRIAQKIAVIATPAERNNSVDDLRATDSIRKNEAAGIVIIVFTSPQSGDGILVQFLLFTSKFVTGRRMKATFSPPLESIFTLGV